MLETEEVSTEKLKQILAQLEKAKADSGTKRNAFELYLKMSENKNADDDLIMQLVGKNLYLTGGLNEETYRILDNGSKALFDDLWMNGPYEFTEKFWRSKHADAKQLTEVFKDYFEKTALPSEINKQSRLLKIFLQHPNVPDDILSRHSNVDANMIAMASNPNIVSKKKTFDEICKSIKTRTVFNGNMNELLEALLTNKAISWDKLAESINLEDNLIAGLGEEPPFEERTRIILEFCKRPECPDNIREYIYERTRDTDFLPQIAKDIFLF